jgi:hypothetical protein
MAHALYDSCPSSPKAIRVVEGGLHKDLYIRDCDALVWAINRFATDLPRNTREIPLDPAPRTEQWVDAALRAIRRTMRRRPRVARESL